MKRIVLIIAIFLSSITLTKATHIVGGEISWICDGPNKSQYRFFMTVFRDCGGFTAGFSFNNQTIDIVGGTLPRTASGQPVNSIVMKPDSARWLNDRNGETAPRCNTQFGSEITCANRDPGTMQAFYFTSDPITLSGIPPNRGWTFFWESPCCRPGNMNNGTPAAGGKSMLLRAIMYPTKNRENTSPCLDDSPEFRSLPVSAICRGQFFTYNSTAIDKNLDSLVYSWDNPINPPQNDPENYEYAPGFSPINPTPDKTFDVNNVPSTLNPISGINEMAIFSGFGTEKYLLVYRVDSWRDGKVIASIFRELPVSVFNCPRLPNNNVNTIPQVRINGVPSNDTFVTITAGQEVRIPIQVTDPDPQMVSAFPEGLMFTDNKSLNTLTNCPPFNLKTTNQIINPCAYLRSQTPTLDPQSREYYLQGMFGFATEFVWQTDCSHISIKTGQPGTREGIYNFVFRVSDDHCPIPGTNYITITVRVKDPIPLTEPIMKGASVELDGQINYQWVPPIDSATTFDSYKVQATTQLDGDPPVFGTTFIEDNLRKYLQSNKTGFAIHLPIGGNPANGRDILTKIPGRDWYIRMNSISGCTSEVPSPPSEPVRVIEVDATPVGDFPDPLRSVARLRWNRAKPLNAATKPYFKYESNTRYYIWENDSISNGGAAVPSNWYLRGNTDQLTFDLSTNVCGDYAGFRIEARDTVITWRQGSSDRFPEDSLITLTYSTFSTIDTLFMVDRGFIPRPRLDTIEVKANGDVYFRIDRSNTGTTGKYSIYANAANPANLIASFELDEQDSILVINQGADTQVKTYIIEGEDGCNPSLKQLSIPYTTFIPQGTLLNPQCSLDYELTWTAPQGFANGVAGYRVYVDRDNNGNFALEQTLGANANRAVVKLARDRTFNFQIVAFDDRNAVNMSAILTFTVDPNIRSFDIVPPMNLRCTYVEDNGDVTVSWLERDAATEDPTNNFNGADGYRFEHRLNNGAWTPYAAGNLVAWEDTSLRMSGLNPQNGRVDIRVRLLSGCDGRTPSAWTEISTIDIDATPRANDPEKRADLSWNTTGVDYGVNSTYQLYKDTFDLRYTNELLASFVNDLAYVDNSNSKVCDGVYNYFVTIEDPLSGCVSRSNIDDARIVDAFPPEPIHLDYVSFNLANGNLDVYWSEPNPGDVDSLFFTTTDGFNSGLQAYRELLREKWNLNNKEVEIPFNILDARDSSVVVGAITQDACDNRSSEEDLTFHKTMHVEVEWSVCDSSMTVTWNPYIGFNEDFDVEYRVYRSSSVDPAWEEIVGSTSKDTTYVDKIDEADITYFYHVRATTLDPAAPPKFVSNSNIGSEFAIFEDVPRYGYLRYVTVLPSNEIELQFNKDTLINVSGYNIYKGTDREFLTPIGYVDYNTVKDEENFKFVDGDVTIDGFSYFYKVVTQSACDVSVDTSNFGRSILLNIDPNTEALTNTLYWNEYQDWDSTVAYYNVYRGVDRMPTENVYSIVTPSNSKETNSFVDDVYDDLFSIGKFCYVVEAVQGTVSDAATNGIPNNLEPATSKSNVVCVTQEPLFYVPNAFAPDGVNQMFGPKGQFFDFSLYEMVIYNRWGEEIYRTRDLNKGWDGTYNGSVVQIGSYVYMIRFIDADGQEHRRKGTVTVIR